MNIPEYVSSEHCAIMPQPSVFDGDIPFLTFFVYDDQKNEQVETGKLWATGGQLSFEGNADASAKVFFDSLIAHNREELMRSNKPTSCVVECPDCKGTKRYVGLNSDEPCAACGGSGEARGIG